MVHQLIDISDISGQNDTIWVAFDRKLEAALNTVEIAASIRLQPEMGHSMDLIRWLEGWNLRFSQQHKTLISIAEDNAQFQCLELSHPSMKLVYISSVNDIPSLLLKLSNRRDTSKATNRGISEENVAPDTGKTASLSDVPDDQATQIEETDLETSPKNSTVSLMSSKDTNLEENSNSVVTPVAGTCEVTADDVTEESRYAKDTENDTTSTDNIQVEYKTVIEITGEYRCNNCGMSRMYCKGDIVNRCENRECLSTETRYTLLYNLF